jgi:hypothetical protein
MGWDSGLQALTDTLSTIGNTVTDGINAIAVGVSSWLGDLSFALDGWQEDDEDRCAVEALLTTWSLIVWSLIIVHRTQCVTVCPMHPHQPQSSHVNAPA